MSEQPTGSAVLDLFDPHEAEVIAASLRSEGLWVALSTNAPSAAGPRFVSGSTSGIGRKVEVYVRVEDLTEAREIVDVAMTATLPPGFTGPEIDAWAARIAEKDRKRASPRVAFWVCAALIALIAISFVLLEVVGLGS